MTEALQLPRTAGHVFKLAGNEQSRLLNNFVEAETDLDAMRATAVICTPAVDDDDESIIPEGIDLEARYRANPTVLWEHGLNPAIPFPIARSETADGQLMVAVANGVMTADSFFTNKVRESEQIFALIEEKIVRGTSVRVDPDYSKVLKKGLVTVYPFSSLIEWSWLPVGCNPEAVAKVLGRNTLAGGAICEPLLKTLKPLLPKRKNLWSPGETNMPTADKKPDDSKAKSMGCDDDSKKKDLGDASASSPMRDKAAPDPNAADTQPDLEEPSTDTPSGQVLSAVTATLQGLIDNLNAAANTYENPDAITFVNDVLIPGLTDLIGQTDGIYSSVSGGKSQPKADDAPPDEEVLKSFLMAGKSRGAALGGYAMRLGNLATAKNLKPDQRQTIQGVMKHLTGLVAKARDEAKTTAEKAVADKAKPAEPPKDEVSPDLIKRIKDNSDKIAALCPAA